MPNVALVGCAHIHTPGFAGTLTKREDVEVVAVWDHDAARAKKYAEQLGAPVVEAPDDIYGNAAVEAVIICSETNRHQALIPPAAAAGKHIFAEKPLGMAARDSWEMARAVEQAGVLFQTGYFMRGQPIHQFLRDHIAKGTFGKVTRLRHSNCHSGSIGRWFDTDYRWMADPKIAGCGAYGDLGTHSLDIILWLLGAPAKVTASIDIALGNYEDCDEYGEGLLKFPDGALATLAAGWVDVANPVSCLVSGTEGHALVCNGQLYLKTGHLEGADGQQPWTDLPAAWPHAFELFIDAVGGRQDVPLVAVREAALRSAVMEALYQGAAQETWVEPVVE